MSIPIINAIRSYLQGDGAAILPEIELVLFGLGVLLIDFWIEQKEKYWNAGLALAGTPFSGFQIWKPPGRISVMMRLPGVRSLPPRDRSSRFLDAHLLAVLRLFMHSPAYASRDT